MAIVEGQCEEPYLVSHMKSPNKTICFQFSVMTVNLQPVHTQAMSAQMTDSLQEQGASSLTVWGLPMTSELPNGRWKRKPTKVWVKGSKDSDS